MEGCTRECCFAVCFCVWQSWWVSSGGCIDISLRQVLSGMEERLCRMKLCPMKGIKSFVDAGRYVLCGDHWMIALAVYVLVMWSQALCRVG